MILLPILEMHQGEQILIIQMNGFNTVFFGYLITPNQPAKYRAYE